MSTLPERKTQTHCGAGAHAAARRRLHAGIRRSAEAWVIQVLVCGGSCHTRGGRWTSGTRLQSPLRPELSYISTAASVARPLLGPVPCSKRSITEPIPKCPSCEGCSPCPAHRHTKRTRLDELISLRLHVRNRLFFVLV